MSEIKLIECRHCRNKRWNDGTRCAGCGLYENDHIKPHTLGASGTIWIDDRHIKHAQTMLLGRVGDEVDFRGAPRYNAQFKVGNRVA